MTDACTGSVYTLGRVSASDDSAETFLSQPYTFPPSISTLAVIKLLPHSLLLLEDGTLHRTTAVPPLPDWLRDSVDAWNGSAERDGSRIADCVVSDEHITLLASSTATSLRSAVFTSGRNQHAQRGVGHMHDKTAAVSAVPKLSALPGSTVITAIAGGARHTLALALTGDVYGWGDNRQGQLFLPPSTPYLCTPQYIASLRDTSIVRVGCQADYSVVLDALGRLWYAGAGLVRQIDAGVPQQLSAGDSVLHFALGNEHAVVLTSAAHSVHVIGNNLFGQLGLTGTRRVRELTQLAGEWDEDGVTSVTAGPFSTFLHSSAGAVWAFGSNQNSKLASSSASSTILPPTPFTAIAHLPASHLLCTSTSTAVFVPSRLTHVSPSMLPSSGGAAVCLRGAGLFAHASRLSVAFNYLTVRIAVDAEWDEAEQCVRCLSPELPAMVVANSAAGVERCGVQVSLDSSHWTAPMPVFVYVPPSWEHASLLPRGVQCSQPSTVSLKVELDDLPYDACSGRLTTSSGQTYTLPGRWQGVSHQLQLDIPELPADTANTQAALSVTLNGQQWHDVPLPLALYQLSNCRPSRPTLSLLPTRLRLSLDGCVLHERPRVKFAVVDSELELTVDAWWVSEEEDRRLQRAEEKGREVAAAAERHAEEQKWARIARAEEEKDDEERRHDEEVKARLAVAEQAAAQQREERLQRWADEDDVYQQLSEHDKLARGGIELNTPSFVHVGPCSARVWLCVNTADWHDSGIELHVTQPTLTRLVPNCGPIAGETRVVVEGDGLLQAESVTVSLCVPRPATPLPAEAVEEKEKDAKGKKLAPTKAAAAAPSTPKSGRRPAADTPAALPITEPPPATTIPATLLPAADATSATTITFVTPALAAATRNVELTFSSAPPAQPAFLSSPTLPFTSYLPPTFTDCQPSVLSLWGGQDVQLSGKGFVPSAHIRVRLTARPEEEKAPAGPAAAKDKKSKAAAAEESKAPSEAATARVKPPPLCVELDGRYRQEEDEMKSPKQQPKGKVPAKGKADDGPAAVILFVSPTIAIGWSGVAEGEERRVCEEMLGRLLDVSVALNGQQFVPTGLAVKYEREAAKGKKPAAAAGKKK